MGVIQRLDIPAIDPWKHGGIRWIILDVTIDNSLLKALMKNAVDIFNSFGSKTFSAKIVAICLDHMRCESLQF